jgi:hypothetical protein
MVRPSARGAPAAQAPCALLPAAAAAAAGLPAGRPAAPPAGPEPAAAPPARPAGATLISFVAALTHFVFELLVFKTMSIKGAASPMIVASGWPRRRTSCRPAALLRLRCCAARRAPHLTIALLPAAVAALSTLWMGAGYNYYTKHSAAESVTAEQRWAAGSCGSAAQGGPEGRELPSACGAGSGSLSGQGRAGRRPCSLPCLRSNGEKKDS